MTAPTPHSRATSSPPGYAAPASAPIGRGGAFHLSGWEPMDPERSGAACATPAVFPRAAGDHQPLSGWFLHRHAARFGRQWGNAEAIPSAAIINCLGGDGSLTLRHSPALHVALEPIRHPAGSAAPRGRSSAVETRGALLRGIICSLVQAQLAGASASAAFLGRA